MVGLFGSMSNEQKHILLVSPGFAKDENDSTCIPALQEFVLGINTHYPAIKVSILSLHYPNSKNPYYWHGNKVYPLGASNCSFPKRILYWKRLKRAIKKIRREDPFDIIHSFWYDEVSYLVSSMKLKQPHFCTFMGQDAIGKNSYYHKIKMNEDKLIALSSFQQKQIEQNLELTVRTVIPWGVSASINTSEHKYDVINIGSFNEIKNQMEAISILHEVIKSNPNLKVLLIGDGPKLESVKEYVNAIGIGKNIAFSGELDRSKVLQELSYSKLLLHCSDYESYGMVFAEAAVCGAMIVSKKVGIANTKSWWKIYSSANQAVSSITELLENPVYPDSSETNIYSVQKTVEEYLKIWHIKKAARETLRPFNQ